MRKKIRLTAMILVVVMLTACTPSAYTTAQKEDLEQTGEKLLKDFVEDNCEEDTEILNVGMLDAQIDVEAAADMPEAEKILKLTSYVCPSYIVRSSIEEKGERYSLYTDTLNRRYYSNRDFDIYATVLGKTLNRVYTETSLNLSIAFAGNDPNFKIVCDSINTKIDLHENIYLGAKKNMTAPVIATIEDALPIEYKEQNIAGAEKTIDKILTEGDKNVEANLVIYNDGSYIRYSSISRFFNTLPGLSKIYVKGVSLEFYKKLMSMGADASSPLLDMGTLYEYVFDGDGKARAFEYTRLEENGVVLITPIRKYDHDNLEETYEPSITTDAYGNTVISTCNVQKSYLYFKSILSGTETVSMKEGNYNFTSYDLKDCKDGCYTPMSPKSTRAFTFIGNLVIEK